MTFASIFNGVKKVLGVEHAIAPMLSMIPGVGQIISAVDPWVGRLITAMGSAEIGSPVGGGALKEATVLADFEAGMDATQAILAATGKKLIWDEGKLKTAIADLNKALASVAEVKASFKIEDLPKQ